MFSEEGIFQRRIGGENITNFPNGIDISDAGDVLIGDSHGNRFHVAVFSRDGTLVSEFECPYVKVCTNYFLNIYYVQIYDERLRCISYINAESEFTNTLQ